MNTIVLTQSIGPSLLVEAAPYGYGVANIYRGAEISSTFGPATPDIATVDVQAHPYRNAPALTKIRAYTPVIVRILNGLSTAHIPYQQQVFQRATCERLRMQLGSSPRLHQILGRDSFALLSVEEYLTGTPLRAILDAHTLRDQRLPEPYVLTLGESLVSLWSAAAIDDIHVAVELDDVFIDDHGHLRTRPTYREEESRQDVGAALLAFTNVAALSAPEEIKGFAYTAQSSMFYLGLLMYEMLTGTHPYSHGEKKLFELFARMCNEDAPLLRIRRPDVHPAIATFVHRCLERDPQNRFPNWDELRAAYRGIQALLTPVTASALVQNAYQWVPNHPERHIPPLLIADEIKPFTTEPIVPIDLGKAPFMRRPQRPTPPIVSPSLDEQIEFAGNDGRPMLRGSNSLLVDARPVTKAELARYYFARGQVFPAEIRSLNEQDDDTCVFVTHDIAEAYAAWAGKRLPTEREWEMAVETLSGERLDVGQIWEWTSSAHEDGGWVVRGGRWRDQSAQPARPENRSFARRPAPDLGFRCVVTREDTSNEIRLDSKE